MSVFYIDVDVPTLDLHSTWYDRYNKDWNDNLTYEMVTEWNLHKFVKPECGIKIYDYLNEPDLYDDVQPNPDALAAIKYLRWLGHTCLFLSAGIHRGKYLRLKQLGFLETEDEYFCAKDKSRFIGDYLIDDALHNVKAFKGQAILYDAPHNRHEYWEHRGNNWTEILSIVDTLERQKALVRNFFSFPQKPIGEGFLNLGADIY